MVEVMSPCSTTQSGAVEAITSSSRVSRTAVNRQERPAGYSSTSLLDQFYERLPYDLRERGPLESREIGKASRLPE